MDEQVMIDLLEANKKLPAQEEILQRFRDDFVDRVQASLNSPERVESAPAQRKASEAVRLKAPAQEAPAGESWSFAEDTNAGDLPAGDEVVEASLPAQQHAPAEFESPAEGLATGDPQVDEPPSGVLDADEFAAHAEAALNAVVPESPTAELSAAPSPDLDTGDFQQLEEQQEAVTLATEALLDQKSPLEVLPEMPQAPAAEDDMMQVPEELSRPEGMEAERTSDGSKKKKKKKK